MFALANQDELVQYLQHKVVTEQFEELLLFFVLKSQENTFENLTCSL